MIFTMLRTLYNCIAILCLLIILVMLGALFLPSLGKSLAEKGIRDQNERDRKIIETIQGQKGILIDAKAAK